MTTDQKQIALQKKKEKTYASAVERVENKLGKQVADHRNNELYQRQKVRDSILHDMNVTIKDKKQKVANNEVLKKQLLDS